MPRYVKQPELTINFTHEKQSTRLVQSEFFTMDNKTARKNILLTHEHEPMDLTDAVVIFAFDFIECGKTIVLDSKGENVFIEDGYVSIILPDGIKYTGTVLMYTYVEFEDGSSLDAGHAIRTTFTESFLDKEMEEMERFYASRFQDLARQVEEMLQNMEQHIYDTVRDLTDAVVGEMIEEKMQPILDTIVEDILAQVMAGDIVTEAQMNAAITAAIAAIDFPEGITEAEVQALIDAAIAVLDFTVSWDNIKGKPVTFPPSAHEHDWNELNQVPATFPPSAHNHPWNQITDVPATFPPSAHTHTWDSITGRPATFPAAPHNHGMNEITGLNDELQSIRNSIPAPCTCEGGGTGGSGGDCSCPSFPLPLTQVNWQNGAINGHVTWTGGNVGLNFGAAPDGAGLQECGIQARSSNTSVLIRGSGRLDTLNRAFFFRPNNANGPTPQDMILFNDGRLNALMYSEDGVLLTDKYLQQDGFMDALYEKQVIPENSLLNSAPPSAYPFGVSFYTTNDSTLGFPHPSLTILSHRFANGRIVQLATTLTGIQWERVGTNEGWVGGTGGNWNRNDHLERLDEITEKLNGHSFWSGTQAQYDDLPSIDPNTLYFIV